MPTGKKTSQKTSVRKIGRGKNQPKNTSQTNDTMQVESPSTAELCSFRPRSALSTPDPVGLPAQCNSPWMIAHGETERRHKHNCLPLAKGNFLPCLRLSLLENDYPLPSLPLNTLDTTATQVCISASCRAACAGLFVMRMLHLPMRAYFLSNSLCSNDIKYTSLAFVENSYISYWMGSRPISLDRGRVLYWASP